MGEKQEDLYRKMLDLIQASGRGSRGGDVSGLLWYPREDYYTVEWPTTRREKLESDNHILEPLFSVWDGEMMKDSVKPVAYGGRSGGTVPIEEIGPTGPAEDLELVDDIAENSMAEIVRALRVHPGSLVPPILEEGQLLVSPVLEVDKSATPMWDPLWSVWKSEEEESATKTIQQIEVTVNQVWSGVINGGWIADVGEDTTIGPPAPAPVLDITPPANPQLQLGEGAMSSPSVE